MKRLRVLWARSTRRDLEAIVAYLAERSPAQALPTLERIEGRAKSLAHFAGRGRLVPELARLHVVEYRELLVSPYRLLYRPRDHDVLVLVVVDGRRSLEDALLERLIRAEGNR